MTMPVAGRDFHLAWDSLGLTASTLPDQTGSANPEWYLKNGNHCKAGGNSCVMYDTACVNTVFCATCLDAVSARDLSNPPVWGGNPF
ncbi:hypothetical protein [Corallococcus macrosporus]|nr:hypothetical protein [Corallococcus macrosporus]